MNTSIEIVPLNIDKDREEIMALIKKGLRDSFEESHLIWKHQENPFGTSYILGAKIKGRLVGLRMFMRWEFTGPNNQTIKAIRPVDTVTDPEFRGMGIFSRLTLKGIEEEINNYELIFNTPNLNSRPGYLKMGWQVWEGDALTKFALIFPGKKIKSVEAKNQLESFSTKGWSTLKSKEFLNWRYKSQDYLVRTTSNQETVIIYRKAKIKSLSTLVISELLGEEKWFLPLIRSVASVEKSQWIYYLANKKNLPGLIHLPFKSKKPFIVYRDDTQKMAEQIQFSLGDLESKL
jgi:GNAT superfamily N-acetyltransferase